MNINEVAKLLGMTRDEVKTIINEGIELPKSKQKLFLVAQKLGNNFDIDETSLDEFITHFNKEEPGRHPPIAVRRELLIEAHHRCGICREVTPIEFHHIIEFSTLKHYDVNHMLALCPTCHTLCTRGVIDKKAQKKYKQKLYNNHLHTKNLRFGQSIGTTNFSWNDVKDVIEALHTATVVNPNNQSKFDLSHIDLQEKNVLNHLSEHYFEIVMLEAHEPYFNRILAFLENPVNIKVRELYFEIVDELRSKIAANRNDFEKFEFFLITFADAASGQIAIEKINRRVLNILLSFMYINCDIGRKR